MGDNQDIQAVGSANTTSFADLAATRRSIRRYLPMPIARELIDSLLETAVTAASAHNRQPWRFLMVETPSAKEKLARAMGERLRADRGRDGDPDEAIAADVARSYARLTGAPALIVICMSMTDMDRYADDKRNQAEKLMATQGTAMAAQNLLLAAHAAGLGACWMCAPLFCQDTVAAALELPNDWEPQAIITLGYPADQGKPFRRRALSEVVRYEKGNP
jgi:coenzyme F420-0:L-glutamate ligase / coenzyme F420-1:gamma-L-glutamate ligase